MTRYGVHTGLQHTTAAELRLLWKRIEALGFDWISIWDHFYAGTGDPTDAACLEAVAMHTALACETERVRVRRARLLDRLPPPGGAGQGGHHDRPHLRRPRRDRARRRLGRRRVPRLRHRLPARRHPPRPARGGGGRSCAACCATRRRRSRVAGSARRRPATSPARCRDPLPLWIGGMGERRTLRIAARFADGWNCPFPSPPAFASKREVLLRHCDDVGRDPAEIRCAVNVGLAWDEDSLRHQFGNITERVRPGVLTGSVDQVVARIGEYVEAGADQVNLALRAPFDVDALEQFSEALSLR